MRELCSEDSEIRQVGKVNPPRVDMLQQGKRKVSQDKDKVTAAKVVRAALQYMLEDKVYYKDLLTTDDLKFARDLLELTEKKVEEAETITNHS